MNTISLNREEGAFEPRYEVIDGQQRIRAIYKFFDGRLSLPRNCEIFTILGDRYDLRGKRWIDDDFPTKVKNKFITYKISVKVYNYKTEQEVAQIFARVQEGLPLSSSEKINAILGYIRDEIKELSHHKLPKKTGIPPHRFNHRWLVAHIVYHEFNDFTEGIFRNSNYTDLRKMYKENNSESSEPRRALGKVKKTFDYLNRYLGTNASLIKKNPDFITICMVASYLLQKEFIIDEKSGVDWGDFIETFLLDVAEAKTTFKKLPEGQSLPADLAPYYRYETNRRREGREQIKERYEFMLETFLERFPSISRRHPQRLFDEYQKRLIFRRSKGSCQEPQDSDCLGVTKFNEGEADHIKLWKDGGPTSIDNGQWLCKHCNRVKNG